MAHSPNTPPRGYACTSVIDELACVSSTSLQGSSSVDIVSQPVTMQPQLAYVLLLFLGNVISDTLSQARIDNVVQNRTRSITQPMEVHDSLNQHLFSIPAVAFLGGLLFGFDTAVIAGTRRDLTTTCRLSALFGITVSCLLAVEEITDTKHLRSSGGTSVCQTRNEGLS